MSFMGYCGLLIMMLVFNGLLSAQAEKVEKILNWEIIQQ